MNFICTPCGRAADNPTNIAPDDPAKLARWRRAKHRQCRGGTWCDCGHVIR